MTLAIDKISRLPKKLRENLCIDVIQAELERVKKDDCCRSHQLAGRSYFHCALFFKQEDSRLSLSSRNSDWSYNLDIEPTTTYIRVKERPIQKFYHDDGYRLVCNNNLESWVDMWLLFHLSGDWLSTQQRRLGKCCIVLQGSQTTKGGA